MSGSRLVPSEGHVGLECDAQSAGKTWDVEGVSTGIDALGKGCDAPQERHC